jgi:flavin reductase (DIM6/NTAB) family NADH-FMN oxidoreductase RutF
VRSCYPAPIALFTTPAPNGVVNFAQFSFFNVVSENLPPIVLGLQSKPDGSL